MLFDKLKRRPSLATRLRIEALESENMFLKNRIAELEEELKKSKDKLRRIIDIAFEKEAIAKSATYKEYKERKE